MTSVDKIMVFEPSYEEFKDFSKYIKYMESQGAHKAGIAKVIPPKEWRACRRYNMKKIEEMDIDTPVSQAVTGQQGLLQLFNVQKKKMKVKEYKELAESAKFKPPDGDPESLERKYWKNVTFNAPLYGADVPGTIYDDDVEHWNINRLNTILDLLNTECNVKILGVNTAYLYFGMWRATFPWHTEDMDLYSINYLHFGAPKFWYAIPPEHGKRLESLAKGFFSGSSRDCPEFLRHKMTIISPHVLKKFSIPVNKMIQEEGQFMITFPYGYHCGFNQGFNCAESTNFATERWIDFGKKAKHCKCKGDSVKIDMDIFIKKFQPEEWRKILEKQASEKAAKRQLQFDSSTEEEFADNSSGESSEEVTDSSGSSSDSSESDERDVPSVSIVRYGDSWKSTKVLEKSRSPGWKRRRMKPGSKREKTMLQLSKRHPVYSRRVDSNDGAVKTDDGNGDETSADHSSSGLPNLQDYLWAHLSHNKTFEFRFNEQLSHTDAKCAICVYFSQTDADMLTKTSPNNKLLKRHNKVEHSRRLVTELCFAKSSGNEEQTMEIAYNFMFGSHDPDEWKLSVCQKCQLTVHDSCYGIEQRENGIEELINEDWLCDKCTFLQSLSENEYSGLYRSTACCLCAMHGGAMKPTTCGQWCHIVCAIACPEVRFVDKTKRGPIDIRLLNPARRKLRCIYCYQKIKKTNGACIQCKSGKCATSFHVMCSFHHGTPLYLGDWPLLIESFCPKHVKQRLGKKDERNLLEVSIGDYVTAKHKNGRYYRGRVLDVSTMLYYKVVFDDKSFCFDLPPQDIEDIDAWDGVVPDGEIVNVLWTDGLAYRAEVTGNWMETYSQIQFEDDSVLSVKRSDLYLNGEHIPKRIQSKLSYASEGAKKFYVPNNQRISPKRARLGTRQCGNLLSPV